MKRTLIRGGKIVTGDAVLGELTVGDLLVEDDRIAAIGPQLKVDDAEVIDAAGMLVLPGFVDTHRHTWQSLLRAVGTDWTLAQYYTGMRIVMGRLYTADDMYLGNYLGGLECINAGITTLYDWSHNNNTPDHADEAIRGLADVGMRAVWAYGNANDEWIPPNNKPTNLQDVRRVRERHFSSDRQLMTMAFAARGPEFTTLDLTEQEFRFARELGIRITVHVGVGPWCENPIRQMDSRGLLKPDMTYVHCNTLTEEDMKLLIGSGGTTSISPDSELNMGMGDLPTLRLLRLGNRPSISVDVVSSYPGDMFSAMRSLLTAARGDEARIALREGRELDPIPLTSREVFEFATQEGARACGLADKIGTLTPGKQADIVLLDTNSPNMMPVNYSYGNIVESAHPGDVHTVMVAGRILKRHGKLVGVDLPALRKKIDAARDGLFERAGLPHDKHWMPKPHLKAEIDTEF
jgi:cytosine/adenosine deaminase-related metal-dependent hydrolase